MAFKIKFYDQLLQSTLKFIQFVVFKKELV